MTKELGLSLMLGMTSGLMFLMVTVGGGPAMMLVYFTPLPICIVGFRNGLTHAMAASMVGVVTVLTAAPAEALVTYMVLSPLSALIVLRLALLWRPKQDGGVEWYPPGRVLGWLSAVGLGMMLVGLVVLADSGEGIEVALRGYLDEYAKAFFEGTPADVAEQTVNLWVTLLPMMVASFWVMISVLNGYLGLWAAIRSGRAVRPAPSYRTVQLPEWMALTLLAAAAVAVIAPGDLGYAAKSVALVLTGPYALVGLAAIHRMVEKQPHPILLLTLFYVTFVVMSGLMVIAVAGLGLMQFWTKPNRTGSGPGEEKK